MMKKIAALVPALLALASLAPAQSDVAVYAHQLNAVHVNVFRPLSTAAERARALIEQRAEGGEESSAAEVSMFFGELEVLADTSEYGYPEEGGCVDIYIPPVIDGGCGELTFETDGLMGTTRVQGTIETFAYRFIPDPFEFQEIGPSQITIDLVVTGEGLIELSPFTQYAAGVCGLPPDTRGVFVDALPELQRDGSMTGVLASQEAGVVDPTAFSALLVQAPRVTAGACV